MSHLAHSAQCKTREMKLIFISVIDQMGKCESVCVPACALDY